MGECCFSHPFVSSNATVERSHFTNFNRTFIIYCKKYFIQTITKFHLNFGNTTGNKLWFTAWWCVGYNRKRWSHYVIFTHTEGQNIRFREIHMFADSCKSEHRQRSRPKWYVWNRLYVSLYISCLRHRHHKHSTFFLWIFWLLCLTRWEEDVWWEKWERGFERWGFEEHFRSELNDYRKMAGLTRRKMLCWQSESTIYFFRIERQSQPSSRYVSTI